MRPDTAPLAGTSPEALIAEVGRDRAKLDLLALSRTIAERPVLMIGAERGIGQMTAALARAAREAHPDTVVEAQYPTDHSFSDSRIGLEAEVLRWLGGPHIMQNTRGQFEALLMDIAEPAEEWLTSAQAMSLARRTGSDRVMPWEQMGQSGIAAPYAERSPALIPPASGRGPVYPQRNGHGTYRGGRSGMPRP